MVSVKSKEHAMFVNFTAVIINVQKGSFVSHYLVGVFRVINGRLKRQNSQLFQADKAQALHAKQLIIFRKIQQSRTT